MLKHRKRRITLCAPGSSPSSLTGVTWKAAMDVTLGPSPEAAKFNISLEKVVFGKGKWKIRRLLDY